ncbi:MAG: proton-conducting transporter membrane subunit [Hyphomonadaceae bacterium]|nr:proton-conducting transporter membrane subunit [Hyphomonadaceae bacterium]
MLSIAFNPGFALLLAIPLTLMAPRAFRPAVIAAAAAAAVALLLTPPFGGHGSFAQIGLEVVPLRLDALAQTFGLAFLFGAAIVGLSTHERVHPLEDGAILAMAGGATSALFAGDLVSFVAGVETAGLAGAWIIFSSPAPGALAAGGRYLLWQWLGGLFLLSGVAFHLADGFGSAFGPLPADSAGGALFLIGLAFKAGAPLLHLWLRDASPMATPHGGAALAMFGAPLAIYGLARGFAGEPTLIYAGLTMAGAFALWALAEDDLRRALTRSQAAQLGLCAAAIGVGTPTAFAAAVAHAFTVILGYGLMMLAVGAAAEAYGSARASGARGVARAMPLTALLYFFGAASAAALPGFAGYVSGVALLAGFAPVWAKIVVLATLALTAALTLARIPFPYFIARNAPSPAPENTQGARLGMALAAFFCLAIGTIPGWLYAMVPPAPLAVEAYAGERVTMALQLIGGACAVWAAAMALRPIGAVRAYDLMDLDRLYAGPAAAAVAWIGAQILRAFAAAGGLAGRGLGVAGAWLLALAQRRDRPHGRGAWGAAWTPLALVAAAALSLLAVR